MSERIELRTVRESDVPEVTALVRDVLAEFGLRFGEGHHTDTELEHLPASYASAGGSFWVALQDCAIVGTCGVFPVAAATFELRKMYLLPWVRGQGLGRRFLDHASHWIATQGGRRIVLDTTEQMTRAIAFYERHGFLRDDGEIRGSRCSRAYAREL